MRGSTGPIVGRPTRFVTRVWEARIAYLYLLPALAFMAAVVGYPIIETFRLSFTDAKLLGTPNYIGFANFGRLFGDPDFWDTLLRTVRWTVSSVGGKIVIGMLVALMLTETFPGRRFFRLMLLPPWIIPIAVGTFAWSWIFNGQYGLINGLLLRIGIIDQPFEILAQKNTAFFAAVANDIWVGVPFVTIMLMAGLETVPKELYEAASVDGAGPFRKFFSITLPSIQPVVATVALLSTVWTFNSFDIIWIMTGGGPRDATTTLVIETYQTAFGTSFRFGLASAYAVVTFAFLWLVSLVYGRFLDLED